VDGRAKKLAMMAAIWSIPKLIHNKSANLIISGEDTIAPAASTLRCHCV
jgi:hypothetical protein